MHPNILIFLVASTAFLIAREIAAKPAAAAAAPGSTGRQTAYHRFGAHDTPGLVNSLNVAKSPLEPVTLALTLDDPRDTSQKSNSQPDQSTTQETQSATAETTTSTPPITTTSQSANSAASDQLPTDKPADQLPTDKPADQLNSVESSTTPEPEVKEVDVTSTKQELETTSAAELVTTTPAAPDTTVATEATSEDSKNQESKAVQVSEATESAETAETATPNAGKLGPNVTDTPTTETSSESYSTSSSVTESPTTLPSSQSSSLPERVEITEQPSSLAADEQTQPTSASSNPPAETSSTSTTELRDVTTTGKPYSSSEATPIIAETPVAPTTTSAPSTQAPSIQSPGEESKSQPCSYLPTYEPEEIQRVFREETTYRNGTIKGKFTYINFDQRYRLVHYTRLPYGPVKIDQVEELGRPESSANQSTTVLSNDVPNAILQLRNILPNSLFGFPFVGPQQSHGRTLSDTDRSYFYSTNSIPTPNLLTPSVPINTSPDHHNQPVTETLEPTFNHENLPSILDGRFAPKPSENRLAVTKPKHDQARNVQQFQYTFPHASVQPIDNQKHPYSLMYNYAPAPLRYQYSPVPVITFGQSIVHEPAKPALLFSQPRFLPENKHSTRFGHEGLDLIDHGASHLHGHEHYLAPFMLAQSSIQPRVDHQQTISAPVEQPKLKIKISKTSRSLQAHRPDLSGGAKLAQLRESPASKSGHVAPSHRQQRQRAGKQNHHLGNYPVNSSPIVFHISKNPSSRVQASPLTGIYNY